MQNCSEPQSRDCCMELAEKCKCDRFLGQQLTVVQEGQVFWSAGALAGVGNTDFGCALYLCSRQTRWGWL